MHHESIESAGQAKSLFIVDLKLIAPGRGGIGPPFRGGAQEDAAVDLRYIAEFASKEVD
jgi:hypothetical protein